MTQKLAYFLAVIALAVMAASAVKESTPAPPAKTNPVKTTASSQNEQLIAALGRVEPQSEEVRVGAEISGKLANVLVHEGQRVHRGDILAVLENHDLQAQLLAAQARVSVREAELRRLVNGARQQERAEAWAAVTEADAVLEKARADAERRRGLYARGNISREESEHVEQAFRIAAARADAAHEHFELINSPAREEDRTRAEAELNLARTEVAEAHARLEKTNVRSPINGLVLRRYLKSGESVSPSPDLPIVTLGDTSRLRVRAEIDESDIGQLRLGQPARVTAVAFGQRVFPGKVVGIGESLGKKNVRTDRTTERVDADILEALIELDDNRTLRPGLRVDVFIVAKPAAKR
jgi:HlyD family secretion protein